MAALPSFMERETDGEYESVWVVEEDAKFSGECVRAASPASSVVSLSLSHETATRTQLVGVVLGLRLEQRGPASARAPDEPRQGPSPKPRLLSSLA